MNELHDELNRIEKEVETLRPILENRPAVSVPDRVNQAVMEVARTRAKLHTSERCMRRAIFWLRPITRRTACWCAAAAGVVLAVTVWQFGLAPGRPGTAPDRRARMSARYVAPPALENTLRELDKRLEGLSLRVARLNEPAPRFERTKHHEGFAFRR